MIVEFVAGEAGIALNQLFAASGWRLAARDRLPVLQNAVRYWRDRVCLKLVLIN